MRACGLGLVVALAACGGRTTLAPVEASATSGAAAAGSSGSTGTASTASGDTGGDGCVPDGARPGVGGPLLCCTHSTNESGVCVEGEPSTGSTGGLGIGGGNGNTTVPTVGVGGTTGGTTGGCGVECTEGAGYFCDAGTCELRGAGGPIQVTLDWGFALQTGDQRAPEDLDLHVTDPSGCEIDYANPFCGAGSLDHDANPLCTDNSGGALGADLENVIYDAHVAPTAGRYTVRVDDFVDTCSGADPDPFEYLVTVRSNGRVSTERGSFQQGCGDGDGDGGCTGPSHVFTFTYP